MTFFYSIYVYSSFLTHILASLPNLVHPSTVKSLLPELEKINVLECFLPFHSYAHEHYMYRWMRRRGAYFLYISYRRSLFCLSAIHVWAWFCTYRTKCNELNSKIELKSKRTKICNRSAKIARKSVYILFGESCRLWKSSQTQLDIRVQLAILYASYPTYCKDDMIWKMFIQEIKWANFVSKFSPLMFFNVCVCCLLCAVLSM